MCAVLKVKPSQTYVQAFVDSFLFLELRSQLKKLQTLVVQIPELVIQSFVRDHYSETEVFVERIKKENNKSAAMLEAERVKT